MYVFVYIIIIIFLDSDLLFFSRENNYYLFTLLFSFLDSETADPIDVRVKIPRESNSMIEEFMLAANISAAKKIFAEFPDCAMLRRHPEPPPSNFDPLVKAGKQTGFEIRIDTGKQLADSIKAAKDPNNPYFNTMLRMIATRCKIFFSNYIVHIT